MNRYRWSFVVFLVCGILAVDQCFGLGIRQPEQGAAAIGQNDAFVAQADDPSAIYYNPAGLIQVTGTRTLSGAYFNGPEATYNGSGTGAGTGKGAQDQINIVSHFYVVSDFGMEWFRAGLGIFTPFGQSVDWGNNNSFRYVTTRAGLRMVDLNPTVSFKILDNLFFGAGYDFYYCDADVRRALPFVIPGVGFLGEGNFRFEGHGEGSGFNVGTMWKIDEQNTIGVSYRSRVDVEFDGHVKVSQIPGALGLGSKVKQHARSEFNFPDIVQMGYAFWLNPRWKLELDGDWTHWDVTSGQNLKSQGLKGTFGLTQAQLKTKLNWEDSWIVALGTQYEVKTNLFLRGGWYFSQNSVPNKTFSPTVADGDRVGVSAGLGYKWKKVKLDVAYQFNVTLDRDVKNNVGASVGQSVNGKYESYSQGGSVSLGYLF